VRIVGKELLSLFLPREAKCTNNGINGIPEDIWDIYPNLEELSIRWLPPALSCSVGHPIHTLGMPFTSWEGEDCLVHAVPDCSGLRTVRVIHSWDFWVDYCGQLTNFQLEWFNSRHLALEDGRGEAYMEYLSRIE
jgi:hypothetical protein